jgi:serine protease Do
VCLICATVAHADASTQPNSIVATPAEPGALSARIVQARERVLPYVVSILTVREDFVAGERRLSVSGGSGTVISAQGHVLTNAHVTQGGVSFRVIFADGKEWQAQRVGDDTLSDLAVLRVRAPDRHELPYATFAPELDLRAGDTVLAMGAPYGFSQSVTMGVVSHPQRLLASFFQDEADYENSLGPDQPTARYYAWIQHDAAISPGNSGGPLVDLSGRIVGVNTRGSLFGGDMAFAIPGPEAWRIAQLLIEHGSVPRADLGLRLRSLAGTGFDRGVLVNSVRPDSPAERAGLKVGDRILALDDEAVSVRRAEDVPGFQRRLAELPIGKPVRLSVAHRGTSRAVSIEPRAALADRGKEHVLGAWGLAVADLTPTMVAARGLPHREGVLVTGVRTGGAGASAKPPLRAGDVLLRVDGAAVTSGKGLARCDTEGEALERDTRLIEVDRNGELLAIALSPAPCEFKREPQPELPKPWAGVQVQAVTNSLAAALGMPGRTGYRVTRVYADGPYARAGGRVGDIIVRVGNSAVPVNNESDISAFEQRVRNADASKPLAITALRDGAERALQLALIPAPAGRGAVSTASVARYDMRVRELSFFDRVDRRLPPQFAGVLVEQVQPGGLAGLAHLSADDIVIAVDDVLTPDIDSLRAALAVAERSLGAAIGLTVRRGRETRLLYLDRSWLTEN